MIPACMPGEKYKSCVCVRRGEPHALCSGALGLRENRMEVCLNPHHGEEAFAIVIDGCMVSEKDKLPRCDGIFLLKQPNKKWVITVELKGSDLYRAYEQLKYTRLSRAFYKDLVSEFRNHETTQLMETSFIVSNLIISAVEKTKMNLQFNFNVRSILQTTATTPVPDLRKELK